jgi:heptosyltransferase-3
VPVPKIWPGEEEKASARNIVPTGGPVLAIGPTANWDGKQWPATKFIELIHRLTERPGPFNNARVMVLSAPNERNAASMVIQSVPEDRRIDIAGKTDLLTGFACLQRATAYIGNDSGLMHLAAAGGVPTVGLFGPSRDDVYGPWGPRTFAVRGAKSYEEIVGDPDFSWDAPKTHMDGLSVEKVEIVIDQLLRG